MEEELSLKRKNEDAVVEQAIKNKAEKVAQHENNFKKLLLNFEEEISDLEHFYNKSVAVESKKIEKWKLKLKNTEIEHIELIKTM